MPDVPKEFMPPSAPLDRTSGWSITLHSIEGGSDKIYEVRMALASIGVVDGFEVFFRNGRRGGTMAGGKKTAFPVAWDVARKTVEKLIKEKINKGYQPIAVNNDQVATTYTAHSQTAFRPHLLEVIPLGTRTIRQAAQDFVEDTAYFAQEKSDGERRMVSITEDRITGINRLGRTVDLPTKIVANVSKLPPGLYDAEQIGDDLVIFDMLMQGDQDLRGLPFENRLAALNLASAGLNRFQAVNMIGATAKTSKTKADMLEALMRDGAEGIVFKRRDGLYRDGMRDESAMKLKFWKTLSAIAGPVNRTARSVPLYLLEDNGTGRIDVGNVTIPPNAEIPEPESVVEIRYLYAFQKGSLYQPAYLGVRSDILIEECMAGQREFKAAPGQDPASDLNLSEDAELPEP